MKSQQRISKNKKGRGGAFFFALPCPGSPPLPLSSLITSQTPQTWCLPPVLKQKCEHLGSSFGHSPEHIPGVGLLPPRPWSSPWGGSWGQGLCLLREQSREEDGPGDVFWSCHTAYRKAVRHLHFCLPLITCSEISAGLFSFNN